MERKTIIRVTISAAIIVFILASAIIINEAQRKSDEKLALECGITSVS